VTTATATAGAQTPTATPVPPTPTYTPVPETSIVLQVAGGDELYEPTLAEFRTLPKAEITADGTKVQGVLLETLAARVSFVETATVTVQGERGGRSGFARYPVQQMLSTTVFVLEPNGHIRMVSSAVGPAEWLVNVVSIDFP
jgi:hypothetical protein